MKPLEEPRGVLHTREGPSQFDHRRWPPPDTLAFFVEHFWMVQWTGVREPFTQHTIPHPSVHIVFEAHACAIYGVHRGRFTRVLEGCGRAFGVKFRPGCFKPFVPWPVSRISNTSIPVEQVFGEAGRHWADATLASDKPQDLAVAFLEPRLAPHDSACGMVAAIAKHIREKPVMRVEELCGEFRMSGRQLQRLLHGYAGMSAKWMIRVYRLHEAIAQLRSEKDLAALAIELGYFDQAHFAKDFKAITGYTPTSYRRYSTTARTTPS